METHITYRYLVADAHSSDAEKKAAAPTVNTRNCGAGQKPPRHNVGQFIQLRDRRRTDRAERGFEVVAIDHPSSLAQYPEVSERPAFTYIDVFVTDA